MKTYHKIFLGMAIMATLTACQPQKTPQISPADKPITSLTQSQQIQQTQQSHAMKIITPDWGVASTLTAMGYPPLATGDIRNYDAWVGEPKLPSDTIDLGARFSPNPERLAQLHAQFDNLIIIDNDFYAHLRPLYGDTPHTAVTFAPKSDIATWQDYAEPTKKLGEIVHDPQRAEQFLSQAKQQLNQVGQAFGQKYPSVKKLAIVQFADVNNLRIYSHNSLFEPTFNEMGLNLQTLEDQLGKGNAWGFLPITLGDLAKLDSDTCLVVIEPFSPMLQHELTQNQLWQRLGYGKSRCITVLPPIWTYGGVSSMLTFAERINQATLIGGKMMIGANNAQK